MIEIPAVALWILLLILIGIFIFYGVVFSFHWNRYGMNKTSKKVARVTYFFVSAIILSAIAFFIGLYNL
jgi:hypothetical protein